MSQELKPCEEMTDAELDAELRENGIDPEQLIQNAFQKVCVLAKEQSAKIAQLERTNAALLGALKDLYESHCLNSAHKQGKYCPVCAKVTRTSIAEPESQKENENG